MSRIVAQFDPSAQAGSFSAAAVNRCSALLFMNESANFLTLDFGGAFPSTILQPWSNRLIRLAQPVQTVNWTVAATLASASAPVSQVYVEAFDPSEALDGITSGPLFRQTNVGNALNVTTATTLQNDNNPSGTNIIEARPNGASLSDVAIDNAGNATFAGTVETRNQFEIHPSTLPGPSYFINMSDGQTLSIEPVGVAGPGNYNAILLYSWENGVIGPAFGIGTANGGAPCFMDASSVLHAAGPLILTSGHQETGFAGLEGTANAGNNVSLGVNFKTVMTNTPSSITLATSFSGNTTVQAATGMTKYGFWLSVKATATGDTYWAGTYTTVGNCLLALDTAAQTFDHHCDACGAVHMAQSFSTALVAYSPLLALSYVCPACGARDCLNTAMTAADEADATPQGSGEYATTRGAQATLIRQLMTALGLEVAA